MSVLGALFKKSSFLLEPLHLDSWRFQPAGSGQSLQLLGCGEGWEEEGIESQPAPTAGGLWSLLPPAGS